MKRIRLAGAFGKLPVNAQVGAHCNVVRPDCALGWQVRAEVQFMFAN